MTADLETQWLEPDLIRRRMDSLEEEYMAGVGLGHRHRHHALDYLGELLNVEFTGTKAGWEWEVKIKAATPLEYNELMRVIKPALVPVCCASHWFSEAGELVVILVSVGGQEVFFEINFTQQTIRNS